MRGHKCLYPRVIRIIITTMATSDRGFASMDEEKQREIASRGGKAAHEKGTAHEFNTEEAREAGRKGGQAVSRDREHMRQIGSLGGKARSENRSAQSETTSDTSATNENEGFSPF